MTNFRDESQEHPPSTTKKHHGSKKKKKVLFHLHHASTTNCSISRRSNNATTSDLTREKDDPALASHKPGKPLLFNTDATDENGYLETSNDKVRNADFQSMTSQGNLEVRPINSEIKTDSSLALNLDQAWTHSAAGPINSAAKPVISYECLSLAVSKWCVDITFEDAAGPIQDGGVSRTLPGLSDIITAGSSSTPNLDSLSTAEGFARTFKKIPKLSDGQTDKTFNNLDVDGLK